MLPPLATSTTSLARYGAPISEMHDMAYQPPRVSASYQYQQGSHGETLPHFLQALPHTHSALQNYNLSRSNFVLRRHRQQTDTVVTTIHRRRDDFRLQEAARATSDQHNTGFSFQTDQNQLPVTLCTSPTVGRPVVCAHMYDTQLAFWHAPSEQHL